MRRWILVLFALSGLIPLVPLFFGGVPNPLWMYSVFVLTWLLRGRLRVVPGGRLTGLRFGVWTLLIGCLLETLAWMSNYFTANPEPALFHPQLIPDLLLGLGFYAGWAAAWLLVTRRWRFSVLQVLCVTGVYGVVFEQNGAVLVAGLSALPAGLIFWLYVFLAHGSTMAVAFLPFSDAFSGERRDSLRYPAVLFLMIVGTLAGFYTWALILQAFGVLPSPRPITDFPLW